MGCGSGRWASLVAPRVGHLNCIDPSSAIDVAKRIVKDKQYEQGVDMQTANLILQLYNAYKKYPNLQKKLEKMPLKKLVQNIWKFVK